ncbi:ATP-binding protein [Aquabacterium sp.]|uniref:ATP-binding protein n=1 Tax=Aquabacterium sp. TaxID=1872578 RepID=UPI002B877628|nr:winged helix-turn-helix domain-containing protein [Aquabacterium sp.]HSW03690.1 winged helix-turn-helix domain-containing protein [Aquabacterium sp.]
MSNSTPPPLSLPDGLRFGRFELRPLEQRLLADGEAVPLGGRAFDLLLALVQRPGQLVTRNELIEQVWPDRVVEENNLSVQVNALRKVLGGEWLLTVPGRGYRFVAALAPAAPAAASGPEAPQRLRTNLPTLQPLLIGRSDDLAALGTLIDQHRLVTLVGPGGVGKTRLAQAVLALRGSACADGACWVELAPVTDPAALPGALATALGLKLAPGNTIDTLVQALAEREMLLALDNAEHLLDAAATLLRTLLASAPGLRLVVTSQTPLRLAEERVQRLGGLAIPQGALPAQAAQAFGAVALFAERAQAADSRFVLADAQVPAVIALCHQLDGNALAIELAAARVPLLGLDMLLAALPERLRVLSANRDRAAPARQQTLRAALTWSHDLLAPREQRLFRRLAVVAGTASLALVAALAQAGHAGDSADGDAWAVLDTLDELVQRSLVEVIVEAGADGDTAAPRYRLLASPRALAAEQLQASGESESLRRCHAQTLLATLDQAAAAMEAGRIGIEAWCRAAEHELDDARAAIAWAAPAGDERLCLSLASALLRVLPAPLHDERLLLADQIERLEVALPPDAPAALHYRAAASISLALAAAQPQRSRAAAWRALAAARLLPDDDNGRWSLLQALCEAADVVVDAADAATAEALLAEALAIEHAAWPAVRRRCTVRVRAAIAAARGDAAEALRLDRELLSLSRAAGDWSPMTQINIADGELRSGDARAAVATGQALVAQLQTQRDDNHLGYARLNLAAAWLALDDTAAARPVLRAAWATARRIQRLSWWCDHAALLAALEGRPGDAAALLAAADAHYAAAADRRQHNEAQAHTRTCALLAAGAWALHARAAPPDALLQRLAFGTAALD